MVIVLLFSLYYVFIIYNLIVLKISAFSVVYNFQGIIMTFQQIYKYNKFTLPIINIILADYPLKELGPLLRIWQLFKSFTTPQQRAERTLKHLEKGVLQGFWRTESFRFLSQKLPEIIISPAF